MNCPECQQKTCYLCKQAYEPEKVHDKRKCLDSTQLLNEAIDGQIVFHKCPQCDCQLEKDGGCSMMECTVCNYKWCWICGFRTAHWFHTVQMGEGAVLCQFLNGITFGFEARLHWSLRLLLTLLVVPIMPVVLYFIFGAFSIGVLYGFEDDTEPTWLCLLHRPLRMKACWARALMFILLLPIRVTIFVLITVAIYAVYTVPLALSIVPYYLLLLFLMFRVPYRWCMKSKRGKLK